MMPLLERAVAVYLTRYFTVPEYVSEYLRKLYFYTEVTTSGKTIFLQNRPEIMIK